MKKRLFWGTLAAAATLVLGLAPFMSTRATTSSVLDYANSIGALNGADTANFVVAATSDGGYIVGGQAAKCIKIDKTKIGATTDDENMDVPLWERYPDAVENADMMECMATYKVSTDDAAVIGQVAPGPGCYWQSRNEDNYYLDYKYYVSSCVDYIAKFRQDGIKEWQINIDDETIPAAIRETADGYRMITQGGVLYVIGRDGEIKDSKIFGFYIKLAKILEDGSFVAANNNDSEVKLYNSEAVAVRNLQDDSDVELFFNVNDRLSAYNNNIFDGSEDYFWMYGRKNDSNDVAVYRISNDMTKIEQITDFSSSTTSQPYIIAVDVNGGALVDEKCIKEMADDDADYDYVDCKLNEYGADGKITRSLSPDKFLNGFDSDWYEFANYNALIGYNNAQNSGTVVVYYLNDDFEVISEHQLGADERIFGYTQLNDGSVVFAGLSKQSTEYYKVDGGTNGIQMRFVFAAEENGDDDTGGETSDGVKNPRTLDDVEIFIFGGAIILSGIALLWRRTMARR